MQLIRKMVGTTVVMVLSCACGSAESMKASRIASDVSGGRSSFITSAVLDNASLNSAGGRAATLQAFAGESAVASGISPDISLDTSSDASSDASKDSLLMGMALVGLIVLQLRRKQKTLPHQPLTSFYHDIESPAVERRKLELTLQS